ncbi:hypothetical protein F4604DRAFT_1942207 [Suillus subluteus]|nr:hypothetical protein F4604DRAFT_1942207 [Suillus subluteus]
MSKANSAAMWDEIAAERAVYLNTIKHLTEKYHTSLEWMSGQMYLGGKLQKKNRSVCIFNAVVSDLKNRDCDWRVLSADEWKAKTDAYQQRISKGDIKQHATRSDKGTHKSRARRTAIKAAIKSSEVILDSDEEDGENIEKQRHAEEQRNNREAPDDSSEVFPDSPSLNIQQLLPSFNPYGVDSTPDGPLDLSIIGAQADVLLARLADTIPTDQLPLYMLP